MSLYGVIVPPNLTPDIRPPRIPIKIETEDETDIEIIGKSGKCIDLSNSQSVSASFREKQAELFRIYDRVRVTNPARIPAAALNTVKGTVPQGLRQYVDMEITHYIQYRDSFGHLVVEKFRKPSHLPTRGIFILEENLKRAA